jgi:large subunit ribosomal protein L4
VATVNIINTQNVKVAELELPESIFNAPLKEHAVYQAVCSQLACRRRGTAATKDRAHVRGGGKKPWRQKGTGHARVGSIRSPVWKGGGVVFGPQPRDYSFSIPKKMRKVAMRSVLTAKLQEDKIRVLDGLEFEKPSTKQMHLLLKKIIGEKLSVVIALGDWKDAAWLSGRNIPGVRVMHAEKLSVYTALQHDYLIFDKTGLSIVEGALKQ